MNHFYHYLQFWKVLHDSFITTDWLLLSLTQHSHCRKHTGGHHGRLSAAFISDTLETVWNEPRWASCHFIASLCDEALTDCVSVSLTLTFSLRLFTAKKWQQHRSLWSFLKLSEAFWRIQRQSGNKLLWWEKILRNTTVQKYSVTGKSSAFK